MITVQLGGQTRWKDSMASSPQVGLTVIANGEDKVSVYTPQGSLVDAGIDAPASAATLVYSAAGNIPVGWYGYFYVYASSNYPFVQALTAAGGQLWPKSNPSPASATVNVSALGKVTLTLAKTAAEGVDKILIYRTPLAPDSATAQAYLAAGQAYYVGVTDNDAAGTTTFLDNVMATQEQLELDNYTAPQFWLVVYESPYWWGAGNPQLNTTVTLDGSAVFLSTEFPWYDGRNGQTVTFDGLTSGGYDGKGSFYFKQLTSTTAQACFDVTLLNAASLPIGTTVARIRGPAGTLYRSKPNNPFSWGWTEDQISNSGGVQSIISVPQQFAFAIGGSITALSVVSTDRLLKVDSENPTRTFALNLGLAGTDGFEGTLRTLDTRFSVTSHHSQIPVQLPNGQSILRGLDAKQQAIVQGGSTSQINVSADVYRTLRELYTDNDASRLYHAIYDVFTELSVFWLKIATQTDSDFTIDTALCYHGPTGTWSTLDDMGITASAVIFDPINDRSVTILGRDDGALLSGFSGHGNYQSGAISPGIPGVFLITLFNHLGTVIGVDGGGNEGVTLDALAFPVTVGQTIQISGGPFAVTATTRIVTEVNGNQLRFPGQGQVDPELTIGADVDLQLVEVTDADVGRYMFLVDIDGRRETYGRIATVLVASTTATVTFDRFIKCNTDISPEKTSAATDAESIEFIRFALGMVDCRARGHFPLDSPDVMRSMEAWVTAQNAQDILWPFQLRFYPEMADQLAADGRLQCTILSLRRDTASNSIASSQWVNKTSVPSTLLPFYSLEVIQRGNEEFKLHDFDIKQS